MCGDLAAGHERSLAPMRPHAHGAPAVWCRLGAQPPHGAPALVASLQPPNCQSLAADTGMSVNAVLCCHPLYPRNHLLSPAPPVFADTDVAMNAVLALGFIGAGTNNARWVAQGCLPLRQTGVVGMAARFAWVCCTCNAGSAHMRVAGRRGRSAPCTTFTTMCTPHLPCCLVCARRCCRLAGILRNLSSYYYKEPTLLFLVRIAQVRRAELGCI